MAKRLEELIVWQLANDLRVRVHVLAKKMGVREDLRFASQLRDSASGVCRNVAEGFGHVRPTEFARFLFIARGSLFELQDHLSDGISRQYWSEAELDDVRRLCKRTAGAINGLIRYLRTAKASEVLERWERSARHGKIGRKQNG